MDDELYPRFYTENMFHSVWCMIVYQPLLSLLLFIGELGEVIAMINGHHRHRIVDDTDSTEKSTFNGWPNSQAKRVVTIARTLTSLGFHFFFARQTVKHFCVEAGGDERNLDNSINQFHSFGKASGKCLNSIQNANHPLAYCCPHSREPHWFQLLNFFGFLLFPSVTIPPTNTHMCIHARWDRHACHTFFFRWITTMMMTTTMTSAKDAQKQM